MEEHCVFCGAPIPDGAVYCQDCAPIVVSLDDEQRRALERLLANETARAAFRENWERVKEAMAAVLDIVKNAIANMLDCISEYINEQEESNP